MRPLVDVDWLREHLGEPGVAVVDCRFALGRPGAGERAWLEGHVPGAAFLDVDRDLAAPPGDRGRHPLPEPADFESAARRAGIGAGSRVIAYDEAGEGGGARLWWLLRHFGHDAAAVLDGGLRAWRAAEGPLRAGVEEIGPGDFRARPRDDDTASAEELVERARGVVGRAPSAGEPAERPRGVAERARSAGEPAERARGVVERAPSSDELADDAAPLLLDARAPERFRGEHEPIDPVAGHIPGARNVPFAGLAPDGRFLPRDELRARLRAAGAVEGRDVVAYCGSGVTAATVVLAAELAGIGGARLYPGSWSEWSRRGLPAARD